MSKKYQVFVSSTYEDLKEERDLIIKAVLEMGHIPVGMEMFSAADEQQWNLIKRQIDQTDYYVVIVAHRYGSMDNGVSYTEKEYDYATAQGVPTLGFVLDDKTKWSSEFIDKEEDNVAKLEALKEKIKSKIVSFWKNQDDLYGKCSIALMKAMTSNPRTGWVRGDVIAGPEVTKEITRLSAENSKLRDEIEKAKQKDKSNTENEEKELLSVLKKNKREVFVWLKDAKDWGEAHESNLLDLFEFMARDLLVEASVKTLSSTIAFEITNTDDYRPLNSIPSNHMREYLSDLASLGLIKPSDKKHSVHDKNEFWTLTLLGRKLHADLRKIKLKAGLVEVTSPED